MTMMATQGAALTRPLYRALLAILLIGAGGSATAEVWVKVGQNEKFTAYADPASMRREGVNVKIWDMFDYKAPQPGDAGKKYLSLKRHTEYDCKQGRKRIFETSTYAENLSKGAVVGTTNPTPNWSEIATGTADQLLLEFACGIQNQEKGGKK